MAPMEEDVLNEWEEKASRTNNKSVKVKVKVKMDTTSNKL